MYVLGIFLFLSNVNADASKTMPLAYGLLLIGLTFIVVALYNVRKLRKINKAIYL